MKEFNLYYNTIYVFLSLSILILLRLYALKAKDYAKINNVVIILFSIVYFFVFSTRSLDVGTDTYRYLKTYNLICRYGFLAYTSDIGFSMFYSFLDVINIEGRDVFYGLSFLYMVPISLAFIFLKDENKAIIFFAFISMFFFKSMGINILRQGISSALFLLALVLYQDKGKVKFSYVLLLLAFFFHAAIVIPVFCFLLSKRLKNITIPLLVYFTCVALSVLNVNIIGVLENIPLLNVLFEERAKGYMVSDNVKGYQIGFRLDFFVFNLIFILIGLYFYQKRNIHDYLPNYKTNLYTFLFITSVFVFMFNYPFSDRFGVLSWVLIPFILQPFVLKQIRNAKLNNIVVYIISIFIFIFFNVVVVD